MSLSFWHFTQKTKQKMWKARKAWGQGSPQPPSLISFTAPSSDRRPGRRRVIWKKWGSHRGKKIRKHQEIRGEVRKPISATSQSWSAAALSVLVPRSEGVNRTERSPWTPHLQAARGLFGHERFYQLPFLMLSSGLGSLRKYYIIIRLFTTEVDSKVMSAQFLLLLSCVGAFTVAGLCPTSVCGFTNQSAHSGIS